ncbi:MAG: hypothetical protein IPL23_19035 [Saprospiraceae bacterium]|nr:hypothetical protein [Saprospiraceae bacterium]
MDERSTWTSVPNKPCPWPTFYSGVTFFICQDGHCTDNKYPVSLQHCPCTPKPKKDSSPEELILFKELQKKSKLSVIGAQQISALRKSLNEEEYNEKNLVVSVDGSYTNESVLKALDEKVVIIGRVRKD